MAKHPSRPAFAAKVLSRSSYPEFLRISAILRLETAGGALLLLATAAALLWANSPAAEGYFTLRDLKIGYEPWHLRLSLGQWASDGLLAIFFFPGRPGTQAGVRLRRTSQGVQGRGSRGRGRGRGCSSRPDLYAGEPGAGR